MPSIKQTFVISLATAAGVGASMGIFYAIMSALHFNQNGGYVLIMTCMALILVCSGCVTVCSAVAFLGWVLGLINEDMSPIVEYNGKQIIPTAETV